MHISPVVHVTHVGVHSSTYQVCKVRNGCSAGIPYILYWSVPSPQSSLPILFCNHLQLPPASPSPYLTPGNHSSGLHFYDVAFSGMSHDGPGVHNLWVWLFTSSLIPLRFMQVVVCISSLFLSYCLVASHGMDISHSNSHLLKGSGYF